MLPFSHDDFEIVKKDILYQGHFRYVLYHFRFRQFSGEWTPVFQHEILERPSAVGVLPYDPIRDAVVILEQFRLGAITHPQSPWLNEPVAGMHDANETDEALAQREVVEEAGLELLDLHPIYDYFVSPGASNEQIKLYIGRVDAQSAGGIHGLAEENEDIRSSLLPLNEAVTRLTNGEFRTAPLIITLQWLQLHRDWLRNLWQVK